MPLPRSWGYADPEVAERALRRANSELIRCAVCAEQGFYREFFIGEEAHDETHDAANAAFRDDYARRRLAGYRLQGVRQADFARERRRPGLGRRRRIRMRGLQRGGEARCGGDAG